MIWLPTGQELTMVKFGNDWFTVKEQQAPVFPPDVQLNAQEIDLVRDAATRGESRMLDLYDLGGDGLFTRRSD